MTLANVRAMLYAVMGEGPAGRMAAKEIAYDWLRADAEHRAAFEAELQRDYAACCHSGINKP
jgi:hypothetical protein